MIDSVIEFGHHHVQFWEVLVLFGIYCLVDEVVDFGILKWQRRGK